MDNTNNKNEARIYNANECCVFRKTKELFGGLSNMASGFPIQISTTKILSSEALYQACRFPHLPEIQEKIILEKSPMSAKMVGKPFRNDSRPDWEDTRIKIMKWCLKIKLAQNFKEFGKLLESTYNKPIVEDSSKDDFWGAIRDQEKPNILRGSNTLGRLLMGLRKFYNENRYSYEMFVVEPLDIPDFKLLGKNIEIVDERASFIEFIIKSTRYNENNNIKIPSIDGNKITIDQSEIIVTSKGNNIQEESDIINSKENVTKTKSKKAKEKYEDQDYLFVQ